MAGVSTIKRGGSRFYVNPDDTRIKVPGVTSIVDKLPKDFLKFWAAKEAAEAAVTNWDLVSELIQRDPEGAKDYLKNAHRRKSKAATDLGSAAHDLFERLARGEKIDDRHVHMDVKPHVRHFREFLDAVQPEFLWLEETVWSDQHGYAGSFDAIARVEGELAVLDWKTSAKVYDSVALQLAAYRYADRIILADTRESVSMPSLVGGAVFQVREGSWQFVPVECGPAVFDVFKALIVVFGWESELSKTVIGKPAAMGGERETGTARRAA